MTQRPKQPPTLHFCNRCGEDLINVNPYDGGCGLSFCIFSTKECKALLEKQYRENVWLQENFFGRIQEDWQGG